MVRRLPEDPIKRRLQLFKRMYQHLDHFRALREAGRMEFDGVITMPSGEDVDLADLMVGLPYLPKRQREAFVLICMQGCTEAAARDELLPDSRSSTPVQQYADSGLVRMVDHYDAKQAGFWPPLDLIKPIKDKQGRLIVPTTVHPLLKRHLEVARKDILVQLEGLRIALGQVDAMMGVTAAPTPAPTPAPLPRPDGKALEEAVQELVATG